LLYSCTKLWRGVVLVAVVVWRALQTREAMNVHVYCTLWAWQ